jgi:hypothetical protein
LSRHRIKSDHGVTEQLIIKRLNEVDDDRTEEEIQLEEEEKRVKMKRKALEKAYIMKRRELIEVCNTYAWEGKKEEK